ncbi:6044_t:CDS:2 [Ambispora gerdemannii]|uniref:6044_t:CDS:1 n=1 Tax=Ambispora gerdemannii TaxID=144530 RepID=A0A9N9CZY2_9GLOM|nr:6044_t:CDS:2 [Ambispora gerdemannii]
MKNPDRNIRTLFFAMLLLNVFTAGPLTKLFLIAVADASTKTLESISTDISAASTEIPTTIEINTSSTETIDTETKLPAMNDHSRTNRIESIISSISHTPSPSPTIIVITQTKTFTHQQHLKALRRLL